MNNWFFTTPSTESPLTFFLFYLYFLLNLLKSAHRHFPSTFSADAGWWDIVDLYMPSMYRDIGCCWKRATQRLCPGLSGCWEWFIWCWQPNVFLGARKWIPGTAPAHPDVAHGTTGREHPWLHQSKVIPCGPSKTCFWMYILSLKTFMDSRPIF